MSFNASQVLWISVKDVRCCNACSSDWSCKLLAGGRSSVLLLSRRLCTCCSFLCVSASSCPRAGMSFISKVAVCTPNGSMSLDKPERWTCTLLAEQFFLHCHTMTGSTVPILEAATAALRRSKGCPVLCRAEASKTFERFPFALRCMLLQLSTITLMVSKDELVAHLGSLLLELCHQRMNRHAVHLFTAFSCGSQLVALSSWCGCEVIIPACCSLCQQIPRCTCGCLTLSPEETIQFLEVNVMFAVDHVSQLMAQGLLDRLYPPESLQCGPHASRESRAWNFDVLSLAVLIINFVTHGLIDIAECGRLDNICIFTVTGRYPNSIWAVVMARWHAPLPQAHL